MLDWLKQFIFSFCLRKGLLLFYFTFQGNSFRVCIRHFSQSKTKSGTLCNTVNVRADS